MDTNTPEVSLEYKLEQVTSKINRFIKISENLSSWRWYKEPLVCHLYVDMLIHANYKNVDYKDFTIYRGQLCTSYNHLSERCGLTRDQVRTALKKLKSTRDVAYVRKGNAILITLMKYEEHQGNLPSQSQTSPTPLPYLDNTSPLSLPTNKERTETKINENNFKEEKERKETPAASNFSELPATDIAGATNFPQQEGLRRIGDIFTTNLTNTAFPTQEDVRAYCKETGFCVNPDDFFAYYEMHGWKGTDGTPLKNWKSVIKNWHKRGYTKELERLKSECK